MCQALKSLNLQAGWESSKRGGYAVHIHTRRQAFRAGHVHTEEVMPYGQEVMESCRKWCIQ